MAKFEFAIACMDEQEAHRKKEGDIIAGQPYPAFWNSGVTSTHLIVIVDGITEQDALNFCSPHRDDGKNHDEVELFESEKVVGKRKYNIPLQVIKDGGFPGLDLDKVRNPSIEYQPLKEYNVVIDASELVAIFYNKHIKGYKYPEMKKMGK